MQRSEIIRKAIERGRERGFVTFDQLDELLPSNTDVAAPEDIEAVMEALSDEGIRAIEQEARPGRRRPFGSKLEWNPARSLHENCACIGYRETPGFDPGASCVSCRQSRDLDFARAFTSSEFAGAAPADR